MAGQVRWNSREAERLLNGRDGPVARDLAAKAAAVAKRAKELCPVSPHGSNGNPPGHLRSSIDVQMGRDEQGLYADIGSDVEYALVVETGSKPHVIEPREKKALAWPGGQHPVKKVDHPGTEAQPYLRPALDSIRDR